MVWCQREKEVKERIQSGHQAPEQRRESDTREIPFVFLRSSPRVRWPASLPHSPTNIRGTVGKHAFCPDCHPLSSPPHHPCCTILILWIWRGGGQEAGLGGAPCWLLFGMLSGGGMEDVSPLWWNGHSASRRMSFPQCFHILADNTPVQGYQF